MNATAIILTCERDKRMSALLLRGLEKYWPEIQPLVVLDTDRSTEADIPGDVRDVVRRVPYLRRVFDAWQLSPTEDIYILDSDCLICGHPYDFGVPAYQGVKGHRDDESGIQIWRDLGVEFSTVIPRFVGGVFSAKRSMWADNVDLAIEYVRECVKRGHDQVKYPGVICEQSLQAGLWRKTYPDNPLDLQRYPINNITPD